MKTKIFLSVLLFFLFFGLNSQIKLKSDYKFQIGYNQYTPILIGSYIKNGLNNGRWGIEHYDGGLNFWIPYPNPNAHGGNYRLFIQDSTGYVGIGRKPTGGFLDVAGDIRINGSVKLSSDERFKTEIQPLKNNIANIKRMNGKSYLYNYPGVQIPGDFISDTLKMLTINNSDIKSNERKTTKKQFGLIAQEVKEIYPDLVSLDSEGNYSIDYIGLIPVLIECIKDQQEIIDAQSFKIKEIDKKISKVDSENNNLKSGNIPNSLYMSPSVSNAFLYQNSPNPFSFETEIKYFVPSDYKVASIFLCNLEGTLVKNYPINTSGEGIIKVSTNHLKAGLYIYSLIVDNNEVDSKRLVISE